MLDTLAGGAVITAGAIVQRAPVEVEVLRAFMVGGKRIEIGTRVHLAPQLAAEMIAANKARIAPAEPEPAPAAEPATEAPPADDAPKKRARKQESNE